MLLSRILPFIAFISLGYNTSAQSYYVEDVHTFHGSLIAGVNFTQVDGDNYHGYDKAGMNVGGGLYMGLSESSALNIELLYVQKGSKGKPLKGTDLSIMKFNINLNYAEIPLQLYYFDRHKNHFGAGFSYARLISSKEIIVAEPEPNIKEGQYPFRKSDVNFLLSGNFHLWKGLFIGGRFQYSLLPIRKNNTPPGFGRSEQYNDIWNFRMEYLF